LLQASVGSFGEVAGGEVAGGKVTGFAAPGVTRPFHVPIAAGGRDGRRKIKAGPSAAFSVLKDVL
jgi:hypothetical protein